MLDSYPHIKFLSPAQRAKLWLQRAKAQVARLGSPARTDLRLGGLPNRDAISTFAPAFERVRESAYLALRRYAPSSYPEKVKFVRAAEVSDFPADPAVVWSRFIGQIDVQTVPGDHLGMLTTHYEKLASVLDRYLAELRGSSE
jgi:thioesterase domain-containing protein